MIDNKICVLFLQLSFGQIPKQIDLLHMWKKNSRKLNECKQDVNNISTSSDKAANLIELYPTLKCKEIWYFMIRIVLVHNKFIFPYCIFCFIFECKYPIMSFILYFKRKYQGQFL